MSEGKLIYRIERYRRRELSMQSWRYLFLSLAIFIVTASANFVHSQQQGGDDDQTRGVFMSTRSESARPRATPRPSPRATPHSTPKKTKTKPTPTPQPTPETTNYAFVSDPNAPLALGYTLYMKDANGDALRVDPSREFRSGDSVRLTMESNIDGYLYVFTTENDGDPLMLYPDAHLNNGDNFVRAHVPYEVPSSMNAEERLRWFTFDEKPAVEKLFIVLTRQPISGVPTKEALVAQCGGKKVCPWKVTPAVWQRVKNETDAPVKISKAKDEGQKQKPVEKDKLTRGIGLAADDPEPSVIRMSASSNTGVLVATLDLIHKQ
jgi:hypothetical protein